MGVFRERWSPVTAGVLIGFLNTMMFAYQAPWTIFAGLRNWGLHIIEFFGFGDVAQVSPFEQVTSVMGIAFLLGAFVAALLAREFSLRFPPMVEAVKGIVGGILMGIGANLARGCTIGGFYSSVAALSASGLFMMIGLFIGTIVGLYFLMWEKRVRKSPPKGGRSFPLPPIVQTTVGVIGLVAMIYIIPNYYDSEDFNELGVIFLFAALIGVANQRSRFCIVKAFREPFMTGDGEMTKAVIISFAVAITGFTVLKYAELTEAMAQVASSAGIPAIAGGVIFGFGMMLAGGCASGSMWRAAEGHVKLMLAVFFFVLSAAATHLFLVIKVEYSYSNRVFLPEALDSWTASLLLVGVVMAAWYAMAAWNEKTEKLVIYK